MADPRQELAVEMIDLLLNETETLEDFRDEITGVSSIYLPSDSGEGAPWTVQGFVVRFKDGSAFRVTIEKHLPGDDDLE